MYGRNVQCPSIGLCVLAWSEAGSAIVGSCGAFWWAWACGVARQGFVPLSILHGELCHTFLILWVTLPRLPYHMSRD